MMQNHPRQERDDPDLSARPLALPAVLLLLAICGALLWRVGGTPRPPTRPEPDGLLAALRGTAVPASAVASWLLAVGWALWGWVALSVLAQATLAALASVTRGAHWVRALRMPLDRLSAPFTRRLFPIVTAGLIVAQLATRPAPGTAAAPVPAPVVLAMPRATGPGVATTGLAAPGDSGTIAPVEHVIAEGDTLLRLAARYYGTEEEYGRLLRANEGDLLADGTPFIGVLVPGERLLIPPASATTVRVTGETIYTVEEGDTLRGIAARFLGDEMRWPEIFAANEGKAGLADGRTLTDPDLIWPGLELVIPLPAAPAPAPPPDPPRTSPALSPSPPPATPAPPSPPPSLPATPTPLPSAPPGPPAPAPTGTPIVAVASPSAGPTSPIPIRGTATRPGAATPIPSIGPPAPRAAPSNGGNGGTVFGLGLGAAALAGAALLAAREARRRLRADPAALTPVTDGFAEPDLARDFAHRRHGVAADPAAIVAATVARTLTEEGLQDVTILAAHHGRARATLILDAFSDDRERIGALAPALAARLGGRCEIAPSASGDLVVRITGLAPLDRLMPVLDGGPTLLPLGVLGNREAFHGNWAALGHILVVGLSGGGGGTILAGLVAALAAAHSPDRLRLRIVARRRALPAELGALPHLAGGPIDPDDGPLVAATLAELREELFRRLRDDEAGAAPDRPEIVVAVDELADLTGLAGEDTTLDLLAREGPPRGIRLLAATARPEALDDALLRHFATRLVLRLLDEEQSLRLLGLTDATELGEGGWLILRLAGRRPLQPDGWSPLTLRGVRVPPEGLAALVQQLLAAWGGSAPEQPPAAPEGGSAPPSDAAQHVRFPEARDARPSPTAVSDLSAANDSERDGAHEVAPAPNDAAQTAEAIEGHLSGGNVEQRTPHDAPSRAEMANERANGTDAHPFPISRPGGVGAAGGSAKLVADAPEGIDIPPSVTDRAVPPIAVRCFGTFEVRNGDRLLDPAAGERSTYKGWELLAFLAASPPGPFARDTLLDRLWADRPLNPRRPANVLNHAVSRLRRALLAQVPGLPRDIVRFERDGTYRLNTDLVASDTHRFLALAGRWARLPLAEALASHREAFALYREELLTGTGYSWVDERPGNAQTLPELYRAEARDFTLGLARRCVREGRNDQAAPLYRRLLDAEPTREDLARELYLVYGALGDRRALVRAHRALRQALRADPDDSADPDDDPTLCGPEDETEETYRQVLASFDEPTSRRRDPEHGLRVG